MHFLQGKGKNFPFPITNLLIFLVILIFGRRKQQESAQQETLASPSFKKSSFPVPDSLRKSVTEADMGRARNRLRIASLERDIIGDALTKIYDAEARYQINEKEKSQTRERPKTKAEERLDAVREEVLKAMERLEQIETEG